MAPNFSAAIQILVLLRESLAKRVLSLAIARLAALPMAKFKLKSIRVFVAITFL